MTKNGEVVGENMPEKLHRFVAYVYVCRYWSTDAACLYSLQRGRGTRSMGCRPVYWPVLDRYGRSFTVYLPVIVFLGSHAFVLDQRIQRNYEPLKHPTLMTLPSWTDLHGRTPLMVSTIICDDRSDMMAGFWWETVSSNTVKLLLSSYTSHRPTR